MRVLLLEDDPNDALILEDYLQDTGNVAPQVTHVTTLAAAIAILAAPESFDVAIVDLELPDSGGLDTIRTIIERAQGLPVIVLTGLSDEPTALAAINMGAQDYLVKGAVDATVLRRSIRYSVERRRLEAARHHLERELAGAQKMEAIGLLAGGVAHDFNNMLTVILGHARLLRDARAEGAMLDASLSAIITAGERAAELTARLLALGRNQVVSPRAIDLNAVVDEVETLVRRVLAEDIRVVIERDPGLWPCLADPAQITQVLINLAVNARDAMVGGGTLTLTTSNARLDHGMSRGRPIGDYVAITVADTGHGMDEATRERIFDPYFTTKGSARGTGLGLASVYAIVDESNGLIDVESRVGEGSRFTVFLPRSDQRPEAPRPSTSRRSRGQETILIVEDEAAVRELLAWLLRESGYRVLTANDGVHGLEVAAAYQGTIHLVITDVVMPRMNGRPMVAGLLMRRPELVVLFLSGHADDAVLRRAVEHERIDYLQKPFQHETLLLRVLGLLDRRVDRAGAPQAILLERGTTADDEPEPETRMMLDILLIEDDLLVSNVIEMLLRLDGHRVDTHPDPSGVAMALATHDYDVVLTDLSVPHGGGRQVLRIVRNHDDGARVRPVVALSAANNAVPQVLAEGFDHFISKPIALAGFARRVVEIVERYASEGSDPGESSRHAAPSA
ncbi:MAG: response regulator [Nannocystaceae bacterium]